MDMAYPVDEAAELCNNPTQSEVALGMGEFEGNGS